MRFFYDALGCPKALVDAEKMVHHLISDGNTLTHDPEEADAIIINTCGFIETAKQESINTILDYAGLKEKNPELKIIVSGCLSERYKGQLKELIPEIDNLLGVRDPSLINQALHSSFQGKMLDDGRFHDVQENDSRDLVFSGMNYAYLKISEGCDRACSFCAIPGIRGPLRSRSVEQIMQEARTLLAQGVKEIILIGEDLCAYGDDLDGSTGLIPLLENLLSLEIPWLRLMYLFPHPILKDIALLMKKYPNLCPYIDMPLQHASPSVLEKMHRPGGADQYLKMFQEIREIIPHISLRSAFIIGFPGESSQDVEVLAQFLKDARIDRVGFFTYSDEEDTKAYSMTPKISSLEIEKRLKYLAGVQQEISATLLEKYMGRTLICINDGIMSEQDGKVYHQLRSQHEAPEIDGVILVPGDQINMEEDDFIKVKIHSVFNAYDLLGDRIEA